MVHLLAIDGASPALAEAMRAKLALKFPLSSFEIDLDVHAGEDRGTGCGGDGRPAGAGRRRAAGDHHRACCRPWSGAAPTGLSLLDAEGRRVARILARADRADLPLIAGEGADAAVPEALAILSRRPSRSRPRLRGLVRVGERRWDVVLDRDQRILLPEAGARPRAGARDRAGPGARTCLARDVLAVDLRNEHRPVLRLAPRRAGASCGGRAGIDTGASEL